MIEHVITIAKKNDAIALEKIRNHPNITKSFDIPYGFVFFEFYHDLIIGRWNDPLVEIEIQSNPKIRKEYLRIANEKNNLLKPLYSKETRGGWNNRSVTGFGFSINTTAQL